MVSIEMGEIETDFPLQQFLKVIEANTGSDVNKNIHTDDLLDEVSDLIAEDNDGTTVKKPKKTTTVKKGSKTHEAGIDIGLPGKYSLLIG